MFGNMSSNGSSRNIVESIVSEEIIPKYECRSNSWIFQVCVPFFKQCDDLIALFSEILFREEEELSFPINVDQSVSSLLDKRISMDIIDEIK